MKVTANICEHDNFSSTVVVNRLEGAQDMGFIADVKINCADCGRPFVFLGLPKGAALKGAAVSFDAREARLAIKPYRHGGKAL